jgi:hypothetical protein
MAKNRKMSPSERVRQKRLASAPAQPAPKPPGERAQIPVAAAAPLHVAPLAPPPVFAASQLPRVESVSRAVPGGEGSIAPVMLGGAPRPPVSATPDLDDQIAGLPVSSMRWTRGVALVAAFAACAGIAVGFKLTRPRAAHATAAVPAVVATVAEVAPDPRSAPPPPPPVESLPEPVAAAPSASDTAAAAAPPASEAAASAVALRDEALKLLEKAKNGEAMAKASAALEADPTDAMPYLVMGSALQDAGRWREAHRAYELCLKNAKHGMVDECRAMLRAR